MKKQAYETTSEKNNTVFKFVSEGKHGAITKVIVFTCVAGDTWNLGFGDQREGNDFDDQVITNNHDLRKVIRTVTNTVYDFLEAHPYSKIYIEGVDERRKALYNHVFKKNWNEIRTLYSVFAFRIDTLESYNVENNYESFVVSKKLG